MKKLFLLIMIFAFIFFAAGCQPTPERDNIVNKQNLEKKIESENDAVSNNETQGTYEDSKNTDNVMVVSDQWNYDNGISVHMDAEFIEPDESDFPVVRIKTREFNKDEIDRIIEYLFSGRTMYKPWERSREDIAKEIKKLKQIINDPSSQQKMRLGWRKL